MKKWIYILLAVLITLTGCSAGAPDEAAMEEEAGYEYNESMSADTVESPQSDGAAESWEEAGEISAARQQKLIREGYLQVTVEDSRDFARQARERAEGLGGFISNLSQYSNFVDGREYVNISVQVRIPEDHFDSYVDWVEEAGEVSSKDIRTTDVTEEYIDLEARIANLKTQEERLQEIVSEAETVEELLAVEQELSRVRGEIESLEGRFRYLQDRVSYSTLNLEIGEERTRPADISGFSLPDIMNRSGAAFTSGIYSFLSMLGEGFIQISYALPFLLFILVVASVIIFIGRKASEKRKAVSKKQEKGNGNDQGTVSKE